MIKINKIKCIKNINFGNNGKCLMDNIYYSRMSINGTNFLILTESNIWANVTSENFKKGFDGIFYIAEFPEYKLYFENIESFYVKNKKELNNLKIIKTL